ncbi:hypothetical protein BS78_10G276600 [Paspalum vaginatum]|nr:hypothetical protein BS78_10G276600 [Paspalum vaginatum]
MIHHLVGVALSIVLLIPYGTEAYRSSHHASQELDQKFHAPINKTNLLVGELCNQTSPHDGSGCGADPTYAIHSGMVTGSGGIYGFVGTMDVYGFSLRHGQGSATAVWLVDPGDGSRSSEQEIVVSRSTDGYLKTGCFNKKCNGFQPENGATIAPGDAIDDVSSPNGAKPKLNFKIIKDGVSGDWLVHCGINEEPKLIGRFPRSLFTGGLAAKASAISFGGVVTAPVADPAPMGERVPSKGWCQERGGGVH